MEEAPVSLPAHTGSMQVEYVFRLLATIVPREPLEAAVYGIHSLNAGVRGLAIEYLDQVLPPAVLERLHDMIAAIPSDADAPEQAVPLPPAMTESGSGALIIDQFDGAQLPLWSARRRFRGRSVAMHHR